MHEVSKRPGEQLLQLETEHPRPGGIQMDEVPIEGRRANQIERQLLMPTQNQIRLEPPRTRTNRKHPARNGRPDKNANENGERQHELVNGHGHNG